MKQKTFNLANIALIGFLFLLFTACSNDLDDDISLLGEWVESSPVKNRTTLFFYTANRMTMRTEEVVEDYRYRIQEDSIFLRLQEEAGSGETALYFRQVNENIFQIENLHPSIPEEAATFMIFRRRSSIGDN